MLFLLLLQEAIIKFIIFFIIIWASFVLNLRFGSGGCTLAFQNFHDTLVNFWFWKTWGRSHVVKSAIFPPINILVEYPNSCWFIEFLTCEVVILSHCNFFPFFSFIISKFQFFKIKSSWHLHLNRLRSSSFFWRRFWRLFSRIYFFRISFTPTTTVPSNYLIFISGHAKLFQKFLKF